MLPGLSCPTPSPAAQAEKGRTRFAAPFCLSQEPKQPVPRKAFGSQWLKLQTGSPSQAASPLRHRVAASQASRG